MNSIGFSYRKKRWLMIAFLSVIEHYNMVPILHQRWGRRGEGGDKDKEGTNGKREAGRCESNLTSDD